jgi:hypothetical protein
MGCSISNMLSISAGRGYATWVTGILSLFQRRPLALRLRVVLSGFSLNLVTVLEQIIDSGYIDTSPADIPIPVLVSIGPTSTSIPISWVAFDTLHVGKY